MAPELLKDILVERFNCFESDKAEVDILDFLGHYFNIITKESDVSTFFRSTSISVIIKNIYFIRF